MNCLDKLNPAERLILESACTDCLASTVLKFQWSLNEVTSSQTKSEDLLFAKKTSTGLTQANVVVMEDVLLPGKQYSLKISAWKPGASAGTMQLSISNLYFFKCIIYKHDVMYLKCVLMLLF